MTPQEINAYIDKLTQENNVSRAEAEQVFWKAYRFVENEFKIPSAGYIVSQYLNERYVTNSND